jgi:hypothetical protein
MPAAMLAARGAGGGGGAVAAAAAQPGAQVKIPLLHCALEAVFGAPTTSPLATKAPWRVWWPSVVGSAQQCTGVRTGEGAVHR